MADPQGADNPLLTTLPPATDYLNYLIVLEHNLNKQQLPTLHGILQDSKLTANIGWDLVHLLLPYLPESQQCLHDIARLGNPREVVLKATELLADIKEENDDNEEEETPQTGVLHDQARAAEPHDGLDGRNVSMSRDELEIDDPQALRYRIIVEMLATLHPRIKTKYPSRFLSTSLQAVLPAYAHKARNPSATEATLHMIKTLTPTTRPRLPPRKSSSHIPTISERPPTAPDPEGQDVTIGTDEIALQMRLMQSFLTFVTEGYVSGLKAYEDIPGLSWSCRYYEKLHPNKRIPDRPSHLEMFAEDEEELHLRDTTLGQCTALARDLKIHPLELLSTISHCEPPENEDEDELPSRPSDVPLSRTGSLFMLCAIAASKSLFDSPSVLPRMKVFPDFANILTHTLSTDNSTTLGGEPEAKIDAILFLGRLIFDASPALDNHNNEEFYNLLQRLTLLSANTPSAPLRYQAHLLASSILQAHPSSEVRLEFIKDTLEHCPYENLKASAVGWLKEEILSAQRKQSNAKRIGSQNEDLCLTSAVLKATASLLLVDLSTIVHVENPSDSQSSSRAETLAVFERNLPFILSVLNFLLLLLSSSSLFSSLQIGSLGKDFDIIGYCDRMRAASLLFQGWIATGEVIASKDDSEGAHARIGEFMLLDQTIQIVMEAAGKVDL